MLKKTFLVTAVFFFHSTINAQFSKGDKMVGVSVGSLFYNNSSSDLSNNLGSSSTGTDNFGISFRPSIGWFVAEDLIIGVSPMINYEKAKQVGKSSAGSTFLKDESSDFTIGIGGFSRYYFKGAGNNLRFFGQYNLALGIGGSKSEGFEYETLGVYVDRYNSKSSGNFNANTGINLGLSKFIGIHASLDFFIGYNFSYTKRNPSGQNVRDYTNPATADVTTQIDYEQKISAHNIVLGVGFQLFLPKKK